LRNKTKEVYPDWHDSKVSDFTFGAVAGFSAQFSLSFFLFENLNNFLVSCPLDVIRKKMQVQNLLYHQGEIQRMMSISEWGKHIVKTEGFRGLFKGFTMHFVKAPLANGTCFLIKNILHKKIDPSYGL